MTWFPFLSPRLAGINYLCLKADTGIVLVVINDFSEYLADVDAHSVPDLVLKCLNCESGVLDGWPNAS